MRPEERDPAYLWDMLEAASRIQQYVAGKTLQDYRSDTMVQAAVERCVEIIGEAARRVSQSFKDSHPEIPWRPIIAQRHIIAHDYYEIDDERVYRVATIHIPELVEKLRPLIPPLPPLLQ